MPDLNLGMAVVLLFILGAEFVNGWTDAPNAIATVVSTRSLSPLQAVLMASVLNLAGVLSGTAVAETNLGPSPIRELLFTVRPPVRSPAPSE
jgi:PiT family inorganic phosphate transporter